MSRLNRAHSFWLAALAAVAFVWLVALGAETVPARGQAGDARAADRAAIGAAGQSLGKACERTPA